MNTTLTILPATPDRIVGDITTVTIGEGRMVDGKLVETPRTHTIRLVQVDTIGEHRWGIGLTLDGARHLPVYLGPLA